MPAFISLFLKGLAMGAANVIPGVSGGTIAFITGIYEELLDSIKKVDHKALQLVLKFQFKEFSKHINLPFLLAVFGGIGVSILSLAYLLEYLFCNYELSTMAFFFGLIAASVYLVGKEIGKWNVTSILMLVIGFGIAFGVGLLNPANANDSIWYLMICGVVAICSMILPGLSGSYILLMMGNYLLIVSAISQMNFKILIPFGIGAVIGIVGFSHLLSFIYKRFRDATIGLLTGFVLGSLYIIWPWKETIYRTNAAGEFVDKHMEVITDLCHEGIVTGYNRYFPEIDGMFFFNLGLIVLGVLAVVLIDKFGKNKPAKSE